MSSVAHGDDAGHHHHDVDVDLTPATWKDGKRYAWLLGLLVPTLPFIAYGLVRGDRARLLLVLRAVPRLRHLPDRRPGRRDGREKPARLGDQVAGAGPLLPLVHLRSTSRSSTPGSSSPACSGAAATCSVLDSIGLALTMAMVSGIAINTAHELGHKRASLERWLSKVALAQSGYGHFFIEHNRGHHVRVATPEDPASSRLGESFWAFLPRTVKGSLTSAWELEVRAARPARRAPRQPQERHRQRLADDGRPVRRADRDLRLGRAAVPAAAGGRRLLAAGGRQLPRALRPAAAETRGRPLRADPPRALAGTATTSPPTCCSTTSSATATTTPTRCAATRRCATWTTRRSCRRATPA